MGISFVNYVGKSDKELLRRSLLPNQNPFGKAQSFEPGCTSGTSRRSVVIPRLGSAGLGFGDARAAKADSLVCSVRRDGSERRITIDAEFWSIPSWADSCGRV